MPNAEEAQQNPVLLQEACRTYASFLGLPSHSALPNYYELLGLIPGTSDERRIVAAAGRRAALLKTLPDEVANPHLQQCLIKQIVLAQKCLVDPARRAIYDAQLKSAVSARAALPRPIPVTRDPMEELFDTGLPPLSELNHDFFSASGPDLGALPLPPRTPTPVETPKSILTPWYIAGGAVALLLLLGLTTWLFTSSGEPPEAQFAASAEETVAPALDVTTPTPETTPPSASHAAPPEPHSTLPPTSENSPAEASASKASTAERARPQSTPGPTPPLVPTVRTNPFADWPDALTLPSRVGRSSALAAPTDSPVTTLGALPTDTSLAIQLDKHAADLDRSITMQVVAEEGSSVPTWRIEFAKVELSASEDSLLTPVEINTAEPIARLELVNGQLLFRWNEACEEPHGDQLRNCALILTNGHYRHGLRLRKVEQLPVHVLNLSEQGEVIMTDTAPLPARETLYLQVTPGLTFAHDWVAEPSEQRVRLNEDLRLIHTTAPEAEIVIRLVDSAGTLRVQIASYYTLAERRYPLSEEKVRTTLINLQKTFTTNRNRIVAAQSTGQALLAEMQRIRNAPLPNGPARPAEISRRKGLLADMAGRVKKMESTISRMQTSLPKTAAAVVEIEQIAQLGKTLHQQAQLNLRIGTETSAGDIPLVEIGAQP